MMKNNSESSDLIHLKKIIMLEIYLVGFFIGKTNTESSNLTHLKKIKGQLSN